MATLILGTVGRIVAGPIGAIVGTLLGSGIDRSVLEGGRSRELARVGNPAVQSATYGEPIPIVVGRMRAAGNLIWTSGIRESTATRGGGKRSGPATTSFSYSASFAVGLVGSRIVGVERIWADGKLIRDANGAFLTPTTMRLHDGDADQPLDPLIASAESLGLTPAYRGLAYAVFEDLPLADYGNRIPNLTFEIVANEATADIGDVIKGLADAAGCHRLQVGGSFPALAGYIAARAGSLGEALAPLLACSNGALVGDDPMTVFGHGAAPIELPVAAVDAHRPDDVRPSERQKRAAIDSQPATLEIAYYDISREYQPGLQRARWSEAQRAEQRSIAAAMTPVQAKALAFEQLAAGFAARSRRTLRLGWRYLPIGPGAVLRFAGDQTAWRVREARFENFVVHLDLGKTVAALEAPIPPGIRLADGGRTAVAEFQPAGPTVAQVFDLPALPGDLPSTPRMWIAASGAGSGWRRAAAMLSTDGGESFQAVGVVEGGSVIGSTLTVLAAGSCDAWDRSASVDVELLADRDWLERRSEAAVLAGANLALIGAELVQFREAEALGARRFRLHGLLRGRRGTESATIGHTIGERFVLIDPARMLALDLPIESLGRHGIIRVVGVDDGDATDLSFTVGGEALRPLSPVHVQATWSGNQLGVAWIRRSRAGFGWADFVDAPLAEGSEAYLVEVRIGGSVVRQTRVQQGGWIYDEADRIDDGDPPAFAITVAQISEAAGPGNSTTIKINRQG